jgi:hypothetical protein
MQQRWSLNNDGNNSNSNMNMNTMGGDMQSPIPISDTGILPTDVSTLGGGSVEEQQPNNNKNNNNIPEHFVIAEQLLRVHKTHVDQIMETLKIEMDTLRDFEQSLENEQSPTPDQVLDYFESVGLCLDQRTTAGNILQREMDRISKGAFGVNGSGSGSVGNIGGNSSSNDNQNGGGNHHHHHHYIVDT